MRPLNPNSLVGNVVSLALGGSAFLWRRATARRVPFVAISGSNGKTTAAKALTEILSRQGAVVRNENNKNFAPAISAAILRSRPGTRAAVIEAGISRPGQMRKYGRLIAPDAAVLTRVSLEHRENIGSIEDIAREKASLLEGLRKKGTAVLNADDEFTSKMRPPPGRRVVRFGRGEGADFRAEEVSSVWPERLRFRVRHGGESAEVRTRLIGEHWVYSLTAAAAAAHVLGVPLQESAAALEGFEPFPNRLQPVRARSGAWIWRDDGLATLPTLEVGLEALRQAQARSRWLMIGDASFLEQDPVERMQAIGRWAGARAEAVAFVGKHSDKAAEAAREAGASPVRHFATVVEAARFIEEELGEGDVVLMKARRATKLARAAFLLGGEVGCLVQECHRIVPCDNCHDLGYRPRPDAPPELQWTPLSGLF